MIHLLFALLASLSWALWFALQWSVWVPLSITGALGAAALTVVVVRRARQRRAARALEKALEQQGEAQLQNARPDKRAEIAALREQMKASLAALRDSNVGGKRRGEAAVYALPWYAIIGPPGVGKTTALRHSGLSFPNDDSGVRGVGGTRNCDWWFTNEAILLDTAGRYATVGDDQKEWLEFLDMLRTHRVSKPLNGLILAVALPDVLSKNDEELAVMGHKLRSRVNEVMDRLRMTLPVYFLVTKCDLVAGFVELFGDMRRSERSQPWGATIPLDADKSSPSTLFDREFDVMLERVHGRAVSRLGHERDRRARESIYQFPIELSAVKARMSELVGQVFAPNAYQTTPMFRGFYFSSGTQEGLPLSRAMERMQIAMGLPRRATEERPRLEPRSYFLHDVFTKVVFPDAELAARSRSEVRRQRFVRLSIAATAIALAVAVAGPSVRSFQNNQALIDETHGIAKQASALDWDDAEPTSKKIARLDKLLAQVKKLDRYQREGAPWSHRFLMYAGEDLHEPLVHNYVARMQDGFVRAVQGRLEQQLTNVTGERYYEERETLKTYLMLSDVDHLDVAWATGALTLAWSRELEPGSDIGRDQLHRRLLDHVRYYLDLLGSGHAMPHLEAPPADAAIVEHARKTLAETPVRERYQSLFIGPLETAVYDPAEDANRGNLQFPPLTLDALFADQPTMLRVLRSRQAQRTQRYYAVPGAYTDKGHFVVLANIAEAKTLLEREAWVVPLSDEEKGAKLVRNLDRLAEDYETSYIQHWRAFIADIELRQPTTLAEARALYETLRGTGEPPVLRLLRTLEDHTQWTKSIDDLFDNQAATRVVDNKINAALSRRLRGLRLGVGVRNLRGKLSRVPGAFVEAVDFGAAAGATPFHQYLDELDRLRGAIDKKLTVDPQSSPNEIARELRTATELLDGLLRPRRAETRTLLMPLLKPPLIVGQSIDTAL